METTGQFFLCAQCRVQVLVCNYCDRGKIYCAGHCRKQARSACMCEAGRRYQSSRIGRFNHAAGACRYRARQQKVTHQGSPLPRCDALLSVNPPSLDKLSLNANLVSPVALVTPRCHFCSRVKPIHFRISPLRCRVRRAPPKSDDKGADRDNFH
jgi:hypothetical protein